MSGPAYLPLFGNDYLADTRHLTTEEHGAYLLLLLAAWRQNDCALPLDDRKLARITGLSMRKWQAIKATILEFWVEDDGRISQPRLRRERSYADQKSESNRENARKRWGKQPAESIGEESCDRTSDGNAPQPQPHIEEPSGSSTPLPPKRKARVAEGAKAGPALVRMSPDWRPGPLPPTVAALTEFWPPGRLEREVEQFRDYWLDRTEKRPGWDRTFHNRIRDIHDRVLRDSDNGKHRKGNEGSAGRRDPRDGFTRALDDMLDQSGAAAGEAGRSDAGPASSAGVLPFAAGRRLR